MGFRLSAVSLDANLTILEIKLSGFMLTAILKHFSVNTTLPRNQPLRLIKSFKDFCKFILYPFLVMIQPSSSDKDSAMLRQIEFQGKPVNLI